MPEHAGWIHTEARTAEIALRQHLNWFTKGQIAVFDQDTGITELFDIDELRKRNKS